MTVKMAAEPTEYRLVRFGEGQGGFSMLIPKPDGNSGRVPFVDLDENLLSYLAAFEAGLGFIIEGPPGCGKTATVQALGELCGRPLFTMMASSDIEPHDLVAVPRLGKDSGYIASPLLAAMITGGICYLDEIGKIQSTKVLSLLASVCDHRRTIQSTIGGFSFVAHPDFRFCASMNAADPPLEDWLSQRLVKFRVDYPSHRHIQTIATAHFAGDENAALLEAFKHWNAERTAGLAPREALSIIAFSKGLLRTGTDARRGDLSALIARAADHVLPRA